MNKRRFLFLIGVVVTIVLLYVVINKVVFPTDTLPTQAVIPQKQETPPKEAETEPKAIPTQEKQVILPETSTEPTPPKQEITKPAEPQVKEAPQKVTIIPAKVDTPNPKPVSTPPNENSRTKEVYDPANDF